MSNIYDSYLNQNKPILSYDDRCIAVFSEHNNLLGKLYKICKNKNNNTDFVMLLSIGSAAVYYFGSKPTKIIINNDSNKTVVTADDFTITSVTVDRKYNQYVMTIEAKNEKYTRNQSSGPVERGS